MSDEAIIRSTLQINKSTIEYGPTKPASFYADVAGVKGPAPGAFQATTTGTDVDLSELTTPGLCRIQNLDTTNFISVGCWNGAGAFFPFMKILAGETWVFRLHPDIESGINTLRVRADTAACDVSVEAFEV